MSLLLNFLQLCLKDLIYLLQWNWWTSGAANSINWWTYRPYCSQYWWAWTLPPSHVGLQQVLMWAKQYGSSLSGAQGCQAAAQDWLFLEKGKLPGGLILLDQDNATAEKWDEAWKSHLAGDTHLQTPWIHPLLVFFFCFSTSSLVFFWKVNHLHLLLEEGVSHVHFVMAVEFRRRERINQGKGVMLWNTPVLWSSSTTA